MKNREKIVVFKPAYRRRRKFQVSAVECIMVLKGKNKAISFNFCTGMHLRQVYRELMTLLPGHCPVNYTGLGVRYYDINPHFKGQKLVEQYEWLDGRPCYSDRLPLSKEDKFMDILVKKGSEAVWKELEKYLTKFD
jgi:hypothetical protein